MSTVDTSPKSAMIVHDLLVKDIFCDDNFNCRGRIAPIDVIDLARSIGEIGLQQPILVQPITVHPPQKYRIVAGHRRYAAFRILEKETIQAVIREDLTELQARKINLVENLKRQDLNMLQEANAIRHFKNAYVREDEVARELGMSRGWVQVRYMILTLPPEVQQEVAAGFLNQAQIRELYGLSQGQQYEAVRRIKTAKLNGEKVGKIREKKLRPLSKRERSREEIFVMQGQIQDVVGNNFGTRCLAWTAGHISDFDLLRDLRDLAREKGIPWEIPAKIIAAVEEM